MPEFSSGLSILRNLRLGCVVGALILFCFPWLDFRCSGKHLARQTGIQVITGSATPLPALREVEQAKPFQGHSGGNLTRTGGFTVLALLAVLAAIPWGVAALRRGEDLADLADRVVGNLALTAFLCLVVQFVVGFPVEQESGAIFWNDYALDCSDESVMGRSAAFAVTPWFFLTLASLAVPAAMRIVRAFQPGQAETFVMPVLLPRNFVAASPSSGTRNRR